VNFFFFCFCILIFLKDFGVAIWLKNGAPAHKLVLGIPLFARTFLLARTDKNDLHSPTIGNGTEGPFTRSAGFLSYFEVNLSYRSFIFILFFI
jgi:chitinase